MKRILLLLCILIFVGNIKAHKFAYVDSQFILEHIPEYNQAKQELDNISYQWQEEIETAYQDIDKFYLSAGRGVRQTDDTQLSFTNQKTTGGTNILLLKISNTMQYYLDLMY